MYQGIRKILNNYNKKGSEPRAQEENSERVATQTIRRENDDATWGGGESPKNISGNKSIQIISRMMVFVGE